MIKKGDTILNDDGTVYATFLKNVYRGDLITHTMIAYTDGRKPYLGKLVERKTAEYVEKRLKENG